MNSSSRDIWDGLGLTPRQNLNYPVLVATIIGNIILLFRPLFYGVPVRPYLALLIILLLIPPAVMGYTNQSFALGVSVGVLPAFILAIIDNPLSVAYIENMVKLGIVWSGLVLPMATVLFVFGVLIRLRTLRGGHMQSLVWRSLVSFTISAIIFIIRANTRLLETGVLH